MERNNDFPAGPRPVIRAMKPCLVSGEDHGCLPLDVKAVRARQERPRPHGTMEVPVIASFACGDTCTIQAGEWEPDSSSNSGRLGRPGWLVRWPRRWGRLPLRGNPNLRSGTTLAEDWQIMTFCAEFGRSTDPWAMGNWLGWAVLLSWAYLVSRRLKLSKGRLGGHYGRPVGSAGPAGGKHNSVGEVRVRRKLKVGRARA